MNKIVNYLKNLVSYKIFSQNIKVYGWEFNYNHQIISSILPYLFEELEITENIADKTNENRDGRIRDKKYITIHDTGDTKNYRNEKYWSFAVKDEFLKDQNTKYSASFQYVVGINEIYHNIPDNEIAYHAGDSTKFDYTLYDTHIKEEQLFQLEIRNSVYYINNQNTNIRVNSEYNNLSTKDLNSQGVLVKVVNGTYHIGETYFNETYKKIANRGGNNNSIGIEVCINQGIDIYKVWQKTAKLVAKLLDENNLDYDSIKQHHYFSGKNCPMTLRENNLYDHFMLLVKTEYDILQFIKEGYKLSFEAISNNLNQDGRVTKLDKVHARIQIIDPNNNVEYYEIKY